MVDGFVPQADSAKLKANNTMILFIISAPACTSNYAGKSATLFILAVQLSAGHNIIEFVRRL